MRCRRFARDQRYQQTIRGSIDIHSRKDRREMGIDVAWLIVANRTAAPVDELHILLERVWDARRLLPSFEND